MSLKGHSRRLRHMLARSAPGPSSDIAFQPVAANSTGSNTDGSSFSGLLTRVEIGHVRIGSAGYVRIRSRGSSSSPSHRA
jgi:hypothetical protein